MGENMSAEEVEEAGNDASAADASSMASGEVDFTKPIPPPKRPMTAFFMYIDAHRAAYKEANPEAKTGEITKALSEAWSKMTPEEQAVCLSGRPCML